MTVDEFLSQLYGDELSDLFVGNQNNEEESRGKILPLMNSGMQYAYAKYKIKYSTEMLSATEDEKNYTLTSDDILSISKIWNSYGRELETTEYRALGRTLYFPCPATVELEVEYKVKPTVFTEEQLDDEVELELPDLLVCWLRLYVASRYLGSQKTEAAIIKSKDFAGQAADADTFYQSSNTTQEFSAPVNNKLCHRGFA